MYNEFYHFTKKPFNITPNPDFLFLSANHKEVFAHLLYGIQNHSGFIEVTGEVGTGKTTVLRTLLNQLDTEDYRLAFVFNPALSALELLQTINREFGVHAASASRSELQAALNEFLLRENRAGRTVVLVIDEAQNLQAEVLEEIRLLSNLETETDKLIQIVLVGQPELAATLSRADLRQLSQRITVRYHLKPMAAGDTGDYLRHRLRVAGYTGAELFEPAAIRAIWRFSRGYPRLINVVCDRALLVGYSKESRKITAAMIRQAINELRRDVRPASGRFPVWLTLGLLVLLVPAWFLLAPDQLLTPAPPVPAAEVQTEPAAAPTAVPGWEDLSNVRTRLLAIPGAESLQQGSAALFASWAVADFDLPVFNDHGDLRRFARSQGLEVLNYAGEFEALLRINLPVLLEFNLPGSDDPRYLALLSTEAGSARIAPPLGDRDTLSLELLKALWTGHAQLLWKNHNELGYLSSPGEQGPSVLGLQDLLQRVGLLPKPASGRYDGTTIDAVTRFQADRGLIQDGRVGPVTLIHLYQAAGLFRQPELHAVAGGGRL